MPAPHRTDAGRAGQTPAARLTAPKQPGRNR